ncbi:MAG: TPM domain-containing protein [Bdellovibrionaceae bacterium]|nr:TPM domain-containing protein [Pseudobdellovibrionaceae bacterium]
MRLFLLTWILFFSNWGQAEFPIPTIKNHVNDEASIIDSSSENAINSLLSAVKKDTGIEMAILTIPSLHGESIEQVSIQVTDKWQLGTKAEDKGLLLLIAVDDRQLRLEVGQGLEGNIPDAYAKRIIEDSILPLFKVNRMSEGVMLGVYQSIKLAAPDFPIDKYLNGDNNSLRSTKSKKSFSNWWIILFWIFFIIVFPRNPLLTALLLGRSSSYRSGGGGFGGGGFGGGGGFSGGGASGRW